MLKVYHYSKCSTCRNAVKWLQDKGVAFEEAAIRETPPSVEELREMVAAYGGEIRKVFNTSGMDYRALGLKDKLPGMSEEEAFDLLRGNGMLVKRPFAIGDGVAVVGFREAEWSEKVLK